MTTTQFRSKMPLLLESLTIPANAMILVTFFASETNLHDAGFLKNNLSVLAEVCLCGGAFALVVALLLRSRMAEAVHRVLLLMIISLFNACCLMALLASAIPYKLR